MWTKFYLRHLVATLAKRMGIGSSRRKCRRVRLEESLRFRPWLEEFESRVTPAISLGTTTLFEGPLTGNGSVIVATGTTPAAPWTAASTDTSWLTIASTNSTTGPGTNSGTGNGLITFHFTANPDINTRVANVKIDGLATPLTVYQAGSDFVPAKTTPTNLGILPPLSTPSGVAVDSNGNLFIADTGANEILEWNPTLGTPATPVAFIQALLSPSAVAVDQYDNIYVADQTGGGRILEKPATGGPSIVLIGPATVIGTGVYASPLVNPTGVAVDQAGDVYVSDNYVGGLVFGGRIVEDSASGVLRNVAFPLAGSELAGVAVDQAGNVYIATNNVAGVPATGNISIFAPPAAGAVPVIPIILVGGLPGPTGVAVDGQGIVYIAENTGAIQAYNPAPSISGSITGVSSSIPTGFIEFTTNNSTPIPLPGFGPYGVITVSGVDSVGGFNGADGIWPYATLPPFNTFATIPAAGSGLYNGIGGTWTRAMVPVPPVALFNVPAAPILGVAVDSVGDVFAADSSAAAILELPQEYVQDAGTITVDPAGGNGNLPVLASEVTLLTPALAPSSSAGWLHITGPTTYASSTAPPVANAVTYSYDPNPSPVSRTTTIIFDTEITVNQPAALPSITSSTGPLPANATSLTITGTGFDTNVKNDTITITIPGVSGTTVTGTVTSANSTSLTVSLSGLSSSTGSLTAGTVLYASVKVDSGTSSTPVPVATIAPVISPMLTGYRVNDPDVNIYGLGFDTNPANDKVTFNNGVTGTVTQAFWNQLIVNVNNLTAGTELDATVTVDGISSVVSPVQVATITPVITPSPAQPVSSVSPNITINGQGFDPNKANDSVTFYDMTGTVIPGVTGTVTLVNPAGTILYVSVSGLSGATLNKTLYASVTVDGVTSSGSPVPVAKDPLTSVLVTSSTASLAATASTLIISGSDFDMNAANDSVTFNNGVTGTVTSASSTSLTVSLSGLSGLSAGTVLDASVTVDGISSGSLVPVATIAASGLSVTSFTTTPTGFVVQFNSDLNNSVLNLYGQGPTCLTLVGATMGPVSGSLVVDPGLQKITFIRTSGLLLPDNYTLTLDSAASAFEDTSGDLLAGNGKPGTNYVTTFTVAAPPSNAVVVSLPNFTRGYGQPVNVPASGNGLPLTLSNGQNVTGVDLQLSYNPALLTVIGFTPSTALTAAGGSAVMNMTTPGTLGLTISAPKAFSTTAGAFVLGTFTAQVPAIAPYGSAEILDISNLSVYNNSPTPQPLPSLGQDAIHLAAFLGDTNGGQRYDAAEVTLEQRVIVQMSPGFGAYPLVDPVLIGDISGADRIQSNDSTLLQREIVQMPVPNIPALPTGVKPPTANGPDPEIFIPQNLKATPGGTVNVPVQLQVTEAAGINVTGFDLPIAFDTSALHLVSWQLGSTFSSFTATPNAPAGTEFLLTASTAIPMANPLPQGSITTLVTLNFQVEATSGQTVINLQNNYGSFQIGIYDNNANALTINPAPTNAATDSVDGLVTIGPSVTTPVITTTPIPTSVMLGTSIADQATVSGNNPTGTVTFNLYNNSTGTGTALYTDSNVTLVSGVAPSGDYTPTATGTYFWIDTYNGDANNNNVTSLPEAVTVNPTTGNPTVWYVNASAVMGGNTGTSWADAFTSLQSALLPLNAHLKPGDQIWVAQGTYKPDGGTGDRTLTFNLDPGVAVYGGFNGTETLLSQADWVHNVTTLSGDIGTAGDSSDNSYDVVTSSGLDTSAVLEGFTITGGNANGSGSSTVPFDVGGGMYNYNNSSPTLNDLIFSGNSAKNDGGGMYNDSSSPTLNTVTFSGNYAGHDGGGMYNTSSSPTLNTVTFSANTAGYDGGGMVNASSLPSLTIVTFSGNFATNAGGGLYNKSSSPALTDVEFLYNSANAGGGLYNDSSYPTPNPNLPQLTNGIFFSNFASNGGGIYNASSSPALMNVTFFSNSASSSGGGMYNAIASMPTVTNTILWGDTPLEIKNDQSSLAVVTYSDVQQGGFTGNHNLNTRPLFVNGPNGNLHLQSGSPVIGKGTSTPPLNLDLDGNPRPTPPAMGAYDSGTTRLQWITPPISGSAGKLAPVRVEVLNLSGPNAGNVVRTSTSLVTMSVQGPNGQALSFYPGSTTAVQAVNGVATFNNLVLGKAGTYRLLATASNMTMTPISSSFKISAAAPSQLVFMPGPSNQHARLLLNPVVVQLQDVYGNAVPQANVPVILQLVGGTSGTWMTLTDASGKATFRTLKIATPGTYTLEAICAINGLLFDLSKPFTISP